MLPNDMLREIAARVAGGDAGRAMLAATCRRWRGLIPRVPVTRKLWTWFAGEYRHERLLALLWNVVDVQDILYRVAYRGSLGLMQWMRARGARLDVSISRAAAAGGHLPMLTYLHDERCDMGPSTATAAIRHGRLECVVWLRQARVPCAHNACTVAARHGQLEC